VNIFVPW